MDAECAFSSVAWSMRQVDHQVAHLVRLKTLGHELQLIDEWPAGELGLVNVDDARKRPLGNLPFPRFSEEIVVVGEKHSSQTDRTM